MKKTVAIFFIIFLLPHFVFAGEPSTKVESSEGDITFYADNAIFWSDSGKANLEVYYKVPYEELQFKKNPNGGFWSSYEISVVFYDQSGEQLFGKLWKNNIKVDTYEETRFTGEYVLGFLPVKLPKETRKVVINLEDLGSGEKAKVERKIEEEILPQENVMISELEFAAKIEPVNQDLLFQKGDLTVRPNPTRVFGDLLTDLYIYYELYGHDSTKTYSGICKIKDDRKNTVTEKTLPIEPNTKEQYVKIEIQNLQRGKYYAEIEVTDGENSQKRVGEFTIFQSLFTQDYDITLYQLSYIASKDEQENLKSLAPEERIRGLIEFWKRRDPTPTTPHNEALVEFYRRIRYANQRWDTYIPGWQTDRGRIYIKYGHPDEVEYHPFEPGLYDHWVDIPRSLETMTVHAYEIWRYYSLPASIGMKKFLFIDFDARGKFELYNVTDEDR